MRYAHLMESDRAAAIHALTHEILTAHGMEHEPFRSWTGQNAGLHQSKYSSEKLLGNGYHAHLKDAGWKIDHQHNNWEDDDPDEGDLPPGTWANTHEISWHHPDSPWDLYTQDVTHHPQLAGALADTTKHHVFYSGGRKMSPL